MELIQREFIYIWYYFEIQLRQIFWYWIIGMAIGSLISVFAKDKIHGAFARLQGKKLGLLVAGVFCQFLTELPFPLVKQRNGLFDYENYKLFLFMKMTLFYD